MAGGHSKNKMLLQRKSLPNTNNVMGEMNELEDKN